MRSADGTDCPMFLFPCFGYYTLNCHLTTHDSFRFGSGSFLLKE